MKNTIKIIMLIGFGSVGAIGMQDAQQYTVNPESLEKCTNEMLAISKEYHIPLKNEQYETIKTNLGTLVDSFSIKWSTTKENINDIVNEILNQQNKDEKSLKNLCGSVLSLHSDINKIEQRFYDETLYALHLLYNLLFDQTNKIKQSLSKE